MQYYKGKKYFAIKTFTYFIPVPPPRKTGYREKEFDKIFYELLQKEFELLDMQTQYSVNGMWIVCLLGALTEKSAILNLDIHQDIGLDTRDNADDIVFEDIENE